jgi:hypothetical protein
MISVTTQVLLLLFGTNGLNIYSASQKQIADGTK